MKKILLIFIIIMAFSACVSAYNTQSMGAVYSLGIFTSKMCCGVVVGDGEYVLTKKDAVYEETNREKTDTRPIKYGCNNAYLFYVSNETGDIYECETVAVMDDFDLALLKLPVKLKYTNEIKSLDRMAPAGRTDTKPEGKFYETEYVGLSRSDEGVFSVQQFKSQKALVETNISDKRLFMCDKKIADMFPGGMLLRKGGFLGIMNKQISLFDHNTEKRYLFNEFSLASYILDYCKENNIPFENTATAEGSDDSRLVLLNQANTIFAKINYGTPDEKIEAVDKYDLKDTSSYANAFKAMAYEEKGDKEKALEFYGKAIELNGKNVFAKMRKAGLSADRFTELKKLAEEYPKDYRIYERLSNAYGDMKNYELAKVFIDKAYSCHFNDPIIVLEKAKIEDKLNNYNGVMACFEELSRLTPGWADSLEFQIQFFIKQKDWDSALLIANYWQKFEPENINIMLYRFNILGGQGKNEEANALYKQILELAKEENTVKEKYNRILEKLNLPVFIL